MAILKKKIAFEIIQFYTEKNSSLCKKGKRRKNEQRFYKINCAFGTFGNFDGGGITSCKEDSDSGDSQPGYVGKIYLAKDGKSYLKIDTKDTATYYVWEEGSAEQSSARAAETNSTVSGRYVEHQGKYTVTLEFEKYVFKLEIKWTEGNKTYTRIIVADVENGRALTEFKVDGKTVEYEEVSTDPEGPVEDDSDGDNSGDDKPAYDDITTPEDFARVTAGTFRMGGNTGRTTEESEASEAHLVTLTKDFFICTHEVTQAEYNKYVSDYKIVDGDNYPAHSVTWFDAIAYCNKRSIGEGLVPYYTQDGSTNPDDWEKTPGALAKVVCNFNSDGYRLPTEAEWEYAARGGKDYKYSGSDNYKEVASYSKITEIKQHNSNDYGIYDMSGNVAEWCFDFYAPYTTDAVTDPVNNEPVEKRYRMLKIIRGGYPDSTAHYLLTVKYRFPFGFPGDLNYGSKNAYLGFRVVRSVPLKG